jgi:hypothetical protein
MLGHTNIKFEQLEYKALIQNTNKAEPKYWQTNPVPVPLTTLGLGWERTSDTAVTGQWPTTWPMIQPHCNSQTRSPLSMHLTGAQILAQSTSSTVHRYKQYSTQVQAVQYTSTSSPVNKYKQYSTQVQAVQYTSTSSTVHKYKQSSTQVHCLYNLFIGQTLTFRDTCQMWPPSHNSRIWPLDITNDTDHPHVTCMLAKHKQSMGMQRQVSTSQGNKHWWFLRHVSHSMTISSRQTSTPLPRCGKQQQVTHVCEILQSWENSFTLEETRFLTVNWYTDDSCRSN